MAKLKTSVLLSDMTRRQMALLAERTGMNQSEIISVAIDRMAREERTMTTQTSQITIVKINTTPEPDPYRRDTGGMSRTILEFDPADMTAVVDQEYPGNNTTTMDRHHNRVLTLGIPGHPDPNDVRLWIEKNYRTFADVAEGHEIVWNGNNHIGRMTDSARARWEWLQQELDDGIFSAYWEFWSVEDWCDGELRNVTGDTTDEELATYAVQWTPIEADHIILGGDILQYITAVRDERRDDI